MLQSAGWQSCLRLSCDRCGESLVTSAINTQLRSARNLLDIDAPLAAGCAGEVSRSPQPHMIGRWSYFRAYRVKAQAIAPSAWPTTAPEFAIVGYPAGIVLDQVAASLFQECGPRDCRISQWPVPRCPCAYAGLTPQRSDVPAADAAHAL